jgi:CxxC motif-containing protein (DUF1111 family)
MQHKAALSLLAFVASFVSISATSNRPPAFGDSLPGLTPSQRVAFADGLADFTDVEEVETGLGPVFNEASCAACHSVPAVGGGSARLETRFGTLTNGQFDPLGQFGGSLIQDQAIEGFQAESVPAEATIVARRRATPLFGLGLVDAVPDGDLFLIAAQEAQRNDGTAGRVHIVTDLVHGGTAVGKFGWKAQVPSLKQFAGDAYLNEMGITNPLFQAENCPNGDCQYLKDHNPAPGLNDDGDGVRKLADFMTMLDAPPRALGRGRAEAGEKVFNEIGCVSCHIATLKTGRSDIPALRYRPFHPYSDFLLHDMGSLGDGIVQGGAKGREIRTAPLWGLRMITTFLHDGRASTVEQAILAHEGQGRAARQRFSALDAKKRADLLEFLKSL